jgi:hypothetical protein
MVKVRRGFQGGGEMRDETNLFGSESAILKGEFLTLETKRQC